MSNTAADASTAIDALIESGEKKILAMEAEVLAGTLKVRAFKKKSDEVYADIALQIEALEKQVLAA